MSENHKKPHSAEFKASAVKLAIESNKPISHTAKDLGVNTNTLYSWIGQYSKPKDPTMRTDAHLYDELKQLKKDLARVTQERDILKKAAAYFAKESL